MISAADTTKNMFRKLFVHRMECLEVLKVQSTIAGTDLRDISKKTSNLKSVSFLRLEKIDGKCIKDLIEANPKIVDISIQEHMVDDTGSDEDTLALVRGIFEALNDCSIEKLLSMEISSRRRTMPKIEQLRNVCRPLRIRTGDISFSFRRRTYNCQLMSLK